MDLLILLTRKSKYLEKKHLLSIFILILFIFSCTNHDFTPKPRGYFRINLPDKNYIIFNNDCPYVFDYPTYANIIRNNGANSEPCWIDIDFPQFNGKIHLSYKKINKNLAKYIEDSRTFVYKHTIKAESIDEQAFLNPQNNVYGILYNIKGDAASSVQFFLTDSTTNFLRGALYFNVRPNSDSLAPVINFVKDDIIHLMETCKWK